MIIYPNNQVNYLLKRNLSELIYCAHAQLAIVNGMSGGGKMISKDSIIVAAKKQSSSELEGETIILHLKSGVYYGLKAVGARIWNLLQEPRTVNEVRDTIQGLYEVEPEQCETDLLTLLQELESEELIEVKHEVAA